MTINLVQGGIFPIKGETDTDSTGLSIAGTIQGEGKLIGTSCLFIRTSACNLRCAWVGADGQGSLCDTPYSSHNPEKNKMEINDIVKIVVDNTKSQNIKHIVISGGEPTMQTEALEELIRKLKDENYHITVETNGTLFTEELSKNIDLISLSPKLKSSTPWEKNLKNTNIKFNQKWAERHERDRLNILALQSFIKNKYNNDFQLKFVVSSLDDIIEIEDIINKINLPNKLSPSDICLMPEGQDVNSLDNRTSWALEEAIKRGWRFTPRLHIQLFGKNRYV